jgi:site-specific recombinase XerD
MRTSKSLTLSQAIEGMLFYERAAGKSPNTIESYRFLLNKLKLYFKEDPSFISITRDQLSPKTILDIYATALALWGWAVEGELAEKNLVRTIAAPKATDPVIETFTKEQLEAMLKACDRTGFFGKRTSKALWKHLLPRLNSEQPEDYLFPVDYPRDPRKMRRGVLMHLLKRIGERAGVRGVHPRRYRHTFAITYLRNGGDVLTLQALLGHADLKMVKRYAQVAASDCARVHQPAR